jgi:hypothetical protein
MSSYAVEHQPAHDQHDSSKRERIGSKTRRDPHEAHCRRVAQARPQWWHRFRDGARNAASALADSALANQESDAQPRRLELDAATVCAPPSSVHKRLRNRARACRDSRSGIAGDGDLEGFADLTHSLVTQTAKALDECSE